MSTCCCWKSKAVVLRWQSRCGSSSQLLSSEIRIVTDARVGARKYGFNLQTIRVLLWPTPNRETYSCEHRRQPLAGPKVKRFCIWISNLIAKSWNQPCVEASNICKMKMDFQHVRRDVWSLSLVKRLPYSLSSLLHHLLIKCVIFQEAMLGTRDSRSHQYIDIAGVLKRWVGWHQ